MSKGISFFLGTITGVLLTLGFFAVKGIITNGGTSSIEITGKTTNLPDGVTMLDKPIPFSGSKNFKVLQVVMQNGALAHSEKIEYGSKIYTDPVVLIVTEKGNAFYDDQVVQCPKDGKAVQIGTYNYLSNLGRKTVPIIRFVKVQETIREGSLR